MTNRYITSRGHVFPTVKLKRTFRLHTQYDGSKPQGGVDWKQHPHPLFPWLHPTRTTRDKPEDYPGQRYLQQQTATGYRTVRVYDQGFNRQLAINNEDSIYLTVEQWIALGLPDLAYNTPQNTRKIEAIKVPDNLVDFLRNNLNSYKLVASNQAEKTITVIGQNWYANRPSDALKPNGDSKYKYAAFLGIDKYMRDRLQTDPEVFFSRNKLHPFMHINVGGADYKVDQITDVFDDDFSTSNDIGLMMGGLTQGATLNVSVTQIHEDANRYSRPVAQSITLSGDAGATTGKTYVDTIGSVSVIGQAPPARGNIPASEGPLNLRLYSVSQSVCNIVFRKSAPNTVYEVAINGLVVAHVFSEYSGSRDVKSYRAVSLHKLRYVGDGSYPEAVLYDPNAAGKRYGSASVFRRPQWVTTMCGITGAFHQKEGVLRVRMKVDAHMLQFFSVFTWGGYSEVNGKAQNKAGKENEGDVFEYPGGTDIFHNTHKPSGGMYDYAKRNGEEPVMDHPEWLEDTNIQHQVLIGPDHEHYVDPTIEIDILYCFWKDNSESKRQANTNEVYVKTKDGAYRFTCGNVTSDAARGDILNKLTTFLCNPVDGNFVASMELFAPGKASKNNGDKISVEIMDLEWYQEVGGEAGGASLPDDDGKYPQPMLPTPGYSPEASGTGIITDGEYYFNGTGDGVGTGGAENDGTTGGGTTGGVTDPVVDPTTPIDLPVGARVSSSKSTIDVVLPRGAINKPAGEDIYEAIAMRDDGAAIYVRKGRLEE